MKFRKVVVWLLCLLLLFSLSGCGKSADTNGGNGMNGDLIPPGNGIQNTESTAGLPENRKLIQTVNMRVETDNLDTVLQQIDDRTAQLNGYIESSNIQNDSAYSDKRYRSATITVRIPAENLDAFLDKVGEYTNIVTFEKQVEDVTLSYVATESRMKALQAEEVRLLELMAKAETLNDLLTVEKRLTEVRTELEKVTSALKVLENQVDYATIHLYITEVKEFTDVTEPETVWERIGTGFVKSLKSVGNFLVDLFVFILTTLPYFVLLGIVPVTILLIIRGKKRKNRKKTEDETKS